MSQPESSPVPLPPLAPEAKPELPAIIQRYLAGESMLSIAPDFGVASRTLYRWMLSGVGDQHYHELVTQALVDRVAEADEMLVKASDACQVARAREIARFARMDFERRRPHLYGPKQEIRSQNVTVVVHRSRFDEADHPTIISDVPQD